MISFLLLHYEVNLYLPTTIIDISHIPYLKVEVILPLAVDLVHKPVDFSRAGVTNV